MRVFPIGFLNGATPSFGVYSSIVAGSTSSNNASTSANFQFATSVWIPPGATSARFMLRNMYSLLGTTAPPLTGMEIAYGKPNAGGSAYAGSPAPTVIPGITVPSARGFYTTPTFDPSGMRNASGRVMVSFGIPAGSNIYYDIFPGGYFDFAAASAAASPITGSFRADNILTIYLQIDGYAGMDRYTTIGDSIALGFGTTDVADTAYQLIQTTGGIPNAAVGAGGVSLQNLVDPAKPWLTDWANYVDSKIIIQVGINDLPTRTVAHLQADFTSLVGILRAAGATRIVAQTITPIKNDTSDANRVIYNAWLKTLPAGIAACADVANALEDPADRTQLLPAYAADDRHWSSLGHSAAYPVIAAEL